MRKEAVPMTVIPATVGKIRRMETRTVLIHPRMLPSGSNAQQRRVVSSRTSRARTPRGEASRENVVMRTRQLWTNAFHTMMVWNSSPLVGATHPMAHMFTVTIVTIKWTNGKFPLNKPGHPVSGWERILQWFPRLPSNPHKLQVVGVQLVPNVRLMRRCIVSRILVIRARVGSTLGRQI